MFIYLFIINVFIKVFLLSPAILKTILYINRAIHEDPIKMEVNQDKSMYEGNQLKWTSIKIKHFMFFAF